MDRHKNQINLELFISKKIESTDLFYRTIGKDLDKEEKEEIKSVFKRECNNCENLNCNIELIDRSSQNCINWENDRLIGEYKVLKLSKTK